MEKEFGTNEGKLYFYGAGQYGEAAIELIGADKVSCFFDRDTNKESSQICGVTIYSKKKMEEIDKKSCVVLTISPEKSQIVRKELIEEGFTNIKDFEEFKCQTLLNKKTENIDITSVYEKALKWVYSNSIDNRAIACNTRNFKDYPEVTGYYIPSLIRWNQNELALRYANWLCTIQKDDGSWFDVDDQRPYIFDSAQIIRGLLEVRKADAKFDDCIIKGCDWILSNMNQDGRLFLKGSCDFGDGRTFHEIIHLYCLPPILEASKVFDRSDYREKVYKIIEYYKTHSMNKILEFDMLSHFYAYVMEALVDLGEKELVLNAMEKIEVFQNEMQYVPAYSNVKWVCSTGLFQLAIVWYKLGKRELADSLFDYGCSLQNASGGWFGGYRVDSDDTDNPTYFPNAEISWAAKYFLDALFYRNY